MWRVRRPVIKGSSKVITSASHTFATVTACMLPQVTARKW